jgi:hypothetical protein
MAVFSIFYAFLLPFLPFLGTNIIPNTINSTATIKQQMLNAKTTCWSVKNGLANIQTPRVIKTIIIQTNIFVNDYYNKKFSIISTENFCFSYLF